MLFIGEAGGWGVGGVLFGSRYIRIFVFIFPVVWGALLVVFFSLCGGFFSLLLNISEKTVLDIF